VFTSSASPLAFMLAFVFFFAAHFNTVMVVSHFCLHFPLTFPYFSSCIDSKIFIDALRAIQGAGHSAFFVSPLFIVSYFPALSILFRIHFLIYSSSQFRLPMWSAIRVPRETASHSAHFFFTRFYLAAALKRFDTSVQLITFQMALR
jgi:hypothetical protein